MIVLSLPLRMRAGRFDGSVLLIFFLLKLIAELPPVMLFPAHSLHLFGGTFYTLTLDLVL